MFRSGLLRLICLIEMYIMCSISMTKFEDHGKVVERKNVNCLCEKDFGNGKLWIACLYTRSDSMKQIVKEGIFTSIYL